MRCNLQTVNGLKTPIQFARNVQTDNPIQPTLRVKPTVNNLSPLNDMQFTDR